jgi:hypothetical protein
MATFTVTYVPYESKIIYPGMVLNKVDYKNYNIDDSIEGYWEPRSMARIPVLRENFLGSIGFRDILSSISSAVLRNKDDDLTQATSRILTGNAPLQGVAYNPRYIQQRNEEEAKPCLI